MEYRIIDKGTGKWLLQQRDKYEKNWRFTAESKSVMVCFAKLFKGVEYQTLYNKNLAIFRIRIEKQKV